MDLTRVTRSGFQSPLQRLMATAPLRLTGIQARDLERTSEGMGTTGQNQRVQPGRIKDRTLVAEVGDPQHPILLVMLDGRVGTLEPVELINPLPDRLQPAWVGHLLEDHIALLIQHRRLLQRLTGPAAMPPASGAFRSQ